jgi:CheY-like chemotaxis protein
MRLKCVKDFLKLGRRIWRALARLFSRNGTLQHTQKRWPTPKPGGKKKNWHGNCAFLAMMNERPCQQRHILVVDDEPLVRQTVQMLLQDDGYVVDEAKSGAEALALFEPGKFDMIFTDYFMPEMKGDQLAAAIKKRSPKQPVVMITAFPEKLTCSNCPLGGIDSFICKPFELETLRTAIARFAPV